jgi:hypothetical protein
MSCSIGGRRGSRTLTSLRRRDFKSLVSAIPPPAHPNTKNGGGTGIRTLDNGFAIRCLSPLGHAASYVNHVLSYAVMISCNNPRSYSFLFVPIIYGKNNWFFTVNHSIISNMRLYIQMYKLQGE